MANPTFTDLDEKYEWLKEFIEDEFETEEGRDQLRDFLGFIETNVELLY